MILEKSNTCTGTGTTACTTLLVHYCNPLPGPTDISCSGGEEGYHCKLSTLIEIRECWSIGVGVAAAAAAARKL